MEVKVKKVVPFILYLLLITLHEAVTRDATAIYGSVINIPALLVLLVASDKSETTSAWFGFAAGLVMAGERADIFGWYALAMAALGVAAYHVKRWLDLESIHTRLIVIAVGVFIHNAFLLVIGHRDNLLYLLLVSGVTGAVYTTLMACVFFLIKDRKLTLSKIKDLF